MSLIVFNLIDTLRATADSLQTVQEVDLTAIHNLEKKIAEAEFRSNTVWMIFAIGLIFMMNLGFACLETGLTRSKNAANVIFKNTVVPVIVFLVFIGWGFNLVFDINNFLSGGEGDLINFGISHPSKTGLIYPTNNSSFWTFFLFHCMLACLATTIISGAVAERIKLPAFLIFSMMFAGFTYPIVAGWYHGDGWLVNVLSPRFHDFAGASLIHSVGGCAALAGAGLLGPRIGKYSDNKILPIMGHNIPIAGVGLFFLWFGWMGLTGGSVFSSDPEKLPYVILITFISSVAGCLGALVISFVINRTHDITMVMNGILAGLVAISAGADVMSPLESFIIGLIAGLFVVFSVLLFDKLKIDDPVGAISVHLMCGIWGTLSVGIFGPLASKDQFISQLIGIASIAITVLALSFFLFFILKKTIGLRVSTKKELEGLDVNEHGMKAYYFDGENN